MKAKRFPPDDPREWLNRARSNLVRAQTLPEGEPAYLEDYCFDAQQAAEKAAKAVLLLKGVDFPWTHDLTKLLAMLIQANVDVPEGVRECTSLTEYATGGRYPGRDKPPTEAEHRTAIQRAEAVVRWAERIVAEGQSRNGVPGGGSEDL